MNRISNILILILIYFIFSSRTCTEENNLKEANDAKLLAASKDSIRKAFEVGHPGNDLLRAYEETAQQKLSDFADYLKVASDYSLDIRFRTQAVEMVRRLFIPGNINTQSWTNEYPDKDLTSLTQLLAKSLSQGMPVWIQPEQIKVLEPLTYRNDSTYTGKLSFYRTVIPFDIQKSAVNITRIAGVDFYAVRNVKSFGKESILIWEVYLGNFN